MNLSQSAASTLGKSKRGRRKSLSRIVGLSPAQWSQTGKTGWWTNSLNFLTRCPVTEDVCQKHCLTLWLWSLMELVLSRQLARKGKRRAWRALLSVMNVSVSSSSAVSGANYRGGPWFASKLNAPRRSSFSLTDICLINLEKQEEKQSADSHPPGLQRALAGAPGTDIHLAAAPWSSLLTYYWWAGGWMEYEWRTAGVTFGGD